MDKSLKKYTCLVADDEPKAREILEAYIQELPYLTCATVCKNAYEVLTTLQNTPIDILFIDIQMPRLSGLDMVKSLENRPKIVFTTAFSAHAVEAFDLGVADYLMKPIAFERFLKAVNRCITPSAPVPEQEVLPTLAQKDDFIFLKTDRTFVKILLADICFVEAYGNYAKVHLVEKTWVVSEKISTIGESLDAAQFVRVHKSFIVAITKIEQLNNNLITVKKTTINVSDTYKKAFFEAFKAKLSN